MSLYKVKNLNTGFETEVRIYRVSALGGIVSNEDFKNLDNLGAAIGVVLKPGYNVSCEGALNYGGIVDMVDIENTFGTVLTSASGETVSIADDDEFIDQLSRLTGCKVWNVSSWVKESEEV